LRLSFFVVDQPQAPHWPIHSVPTLSHRSGLRFMGVAGFPVRDTSNLDNRQDAQDRHFFGNAKIKSKMKQQPQC
jgi:hypothetical protein